MAMTFALLSLSITITESMAGMLGFGIILAVSLSSCIRSKIWSLYDSIVVSLSLFRFILQSWTMLDMFLIIFYNHFRYEENMLVVLKTVYFFLNYSSVWSGAWFSVFYCVKVASFTQSFFIWLKQRIASLVPWMLITSSLCSFTAALPFAWGAYGMHDNSAAPLTVTNSSKTGVTRKDSLTLLILLCNAGLGLPLMLSVLSSILLIQSLWILVMWIIVMVACPIGHSMVLIWSNPKFRELLVRIFAPCKLSRQN